MLELLADDSTALLTERPAAPVLLKMGDGPKILTREHLDELLSNRRIPYPGVTLSKEGQRVPVSRYTRGEQGALGTTRTVDVPSVLREYAAGATVVIEYLNDVDFGIAELCAGVSRDLHETIRASAFWSPPMSRGFAAHYDTTDAFIVQTEGAKLWECYYPPFVAPREADEFRGEAFYPGLSERLSSQPDFATTLRPGDVLYLPRGWMHRCSTGDEHSIHLAIVRHSLTNEWLLQQLVSLVVSEEWAREYLEVPAPGESIRLEAISEVLDKFRDWFNDNSSVTSRSVAGRMLSKEATPGPRPSEIIRLCESPSSSFGWHGVSGYAHQDDELKVLLAGGEILSFEGDSARVLGRSLDSGRESVLSQSDLTSVLGTDEATSLMIQLLSRGALHLR